MKITLLSLLVAAALTACGGGGSAPATSTLGSSIVVSGQVTDGPIQGAKVCLFDNGVQANNTDGSPICSSQTDSQGNYTLTIPGTLSSSSLTLVAIKGTDIKLVSSLGTSANVASAAGNTGTVTPAALPSLKISNFTTADFVLADSNKDGVVSPAELAAYSSDYAKSRPLAALIKAVIDFGQSPILASGNTTNTLLLASAAGAGMTFGASNQTVSQWVADPKNATVLAAVDQDAISTIPTGPTNYQLSFFVTSFQIPPTIFVKNSSGSVTDSIYCSVNSTNKSVPVQITLDPVRGLSIFKVGTNQLVGNYVPSTGAISLSKAEPRAVSLVGNTGTTFYSEGNIQFNGTVSASGQLTGSYSESSATTWSLNTTRQECTATGTFTATKL